MDIKSYQRSGQKKNTTVAPAVTYYDDSVRPTNDKPDRSRFSTHYTLDLSQVINRWNVARLGFDFGHESGYLTDPYKQVLVGTEAQDERRPSTRDSQAYSAGWRTKPFRPVAFDVMAAYYWDSWHVRSRSVRLMGLAELGEHWLVELMYRFYYQNPAYFWADEYPSYNTDRYRSSDTRLSHFVSNTYSATATYKATEAWWIEGALAYYAQNGRRDNNTVLWSQGDSVISATIYSLAVQYRWW